MDPTKQLTYRNKFLKKRYLLWLSIFLAAAVLLIFFLQIYNLALWHDEAYTGMLARHGFSEIIRKTAKDAHPPFYYIILSGWINFFGSAELSLRSLSYIFHILNATGLYFLGKEIFKNKKIGVFAALFYIVSPLAIRHSYNIRPYSFLGFLSILSLFLFFRIFYKNNNSKKEEIIFVIVNIMGTFTHYYFIFFLFSQFITGILISSKKSFKRTVLLYFFSVVPFVMIWLPVVISQIQRKSVYNWVEQPGIYALSACVAVLVRGVDEPHFWVNKYFYVIYFLFCISIFYKLDFKNKKIKRKKIYTKYILKKNNLILLSIFVFFLITQFIAARIVPVYMLRYTIFALIPFVLLVSSLLVKFLSVYTLSGLYLILLLITSGNFMGYAGRITEYWDNRKTVQYLLENSKKNDILIFTGLSRISMEYYIHRLDKIENFHMFSFPLEVASHKGWYSYNPDSYNRSILRKDADRIVNSSKSSQEEGNSIWLFYEDFEDINQILKNRLAENFNRKKELKYPSSYYWLPYEKVYEYTFD